MNVLLKVCIILAIAQIIYAPPVTKTEKKEEPSDSLDAIHYAHYLKEIVKILEDDEHFKEILKNASEEDIKSGKIAEHLESLDVNVRNRLTEKKNYELRRLLDLQHSLSEYEHNENKLDGDPLHGHIDLTEPKFEVSDLKKLIAKTTEDLVEIDRRRREEFKQYELHKEYEKQDKLNHTKTADDRKNLEKFYDDLDKKHKEHKPLHQPGHQPQLEEVWHEQDHMQQKFDPVTFFTMHDPNSDGYWDQNEVKALFIKELNKLYESGLPEDDLRERAEEMERMREAVFQEMDFDRDGLISREEFVRQTRQNDFKQDHGWKGIDQQERQFSDEEYQEYARQQYLLQQQPGYGQYPPQYYQKQRHHAPHPGQYPPQYYQQPEGGYPQGQQPHPGVQYHQPGQPQPPYQAHPGQQYQPQVGQQYQHIPNQPSPGQQYQAQVGQQYQAPNQPPPVQQYQPQVSNQPVPPPVQQQPPQAQQANPPPLQNRQPPQADPPQVLSNPPKPAAAQAP